MGHEKFIDTCNLLVYRVSVYRGLTVLFKIIIFDISKSKKYKKVMEKLAV